MSVDVATTVIHRALDPTGLIYGALEDKPDYKSPNMGSLVQSVYDEVDETMSKLSIPELIGKKRDGNSLDAKEIQLFVDSVTKNTMQECQIGN